MGTEVILKEETFPGEGWYKLSPKSVKAMVNKRIQELGISPEEVVKVTRERIEHLESGVTLVTSLDYTDFWIEDTGLPVKL